MDPFTIDQDAIPRHEGARHPVPRPHSPAHRQEAPDASSTALPALPTLPAQDESQARSGRLHRLDRFVTPETARAPVPLWWFHALLAHLTMCFSPFPCGTCVLSVSCRYLALDGIYHPLGLQSRATRLYGTSTKDGTETRARYGIVKRIFPPSRLKLRFRAITLIEQSLFY
jgi:hypothetical protein